MSISHQDASGQPSRDVARLGAILLGASLLLACGPKDAGTISVSAGDKTSAIEPDFGNTGAATPAPEPDKGAAPKSIKR